MANDVTFRLGAEAQQLIAKLGEAQAALRKFSAEAKQGPQDAAPSFEKLGSSLNALGSNVSGLGLRVSAALTAPIVAAGGFAIKTSLDYEQAFANVRKTVNASDKDLDQLALRFRQLSTEIPVSAEELARLGALAGQMGIHGVKDIEKFTIHVAALGVAVDGISGEEAAQSLAQIAKVTGTSIDQIDKMASSLVHLGNNTAANEGMILNFAQRLAGAGHTIGLTVPEIFGLSASMAGLGINAEAGGSAFSRVMTDISMAVSKGGEDLEAFASVTQLTAAEFAETFRRDPIVAIQLFIDGLSRTKETGADLNLLLEKMDLDTLRVGDTMRRLAGALGQVGDKNQFAAVGFDSGRKHLEEFEKKAATSSNQLKQTGLMLTEVSRTVGDAFVPILVDAVRGLTPFIQLLQAAAEQFKALPQPVREGVAGMTALAALSGPLILFTGQTIQAGGSILQLIDKIQKWRTAQLGATAATEAAAVAMSRSWIAAAATLLGRFTLIGGGILVVKAAADALRESSGLTAEELSKFAGQSAVTGADLDKLAFGVEHASEAAKDAAGTLQTTAERAAELRDEISGVRLAKDMAALTQLVREFAAEGKLTPDVMRRIADQARILAGQGQQLSPELRSIVDNIHRLKPASESGAGGLSALERGMAAAAVRAERYKADLEKLGTEGLAKVRDEHLKAGTSVEQLAQDFGVSEDTLRRYFKELEATKDGTEKLTKKTDELAQKIRQAEAAGAPLSAILHEFGQEAANAASEATTLGQKVPEAVQKIADAFQRAKVNELMTKATQEWLNAIEGFQKEGLEKANAFLDTLGKDWLANEKLITEAQRGEQLIRLKMTGDELGERLFQIKTFYQDKRTEVQQDQANYEETIAAINAMEKAAIDAAFKEYVDGFKKRGDAVKTFREQFQSNIQALAQSLTNLAQIADGSLGQVFEWLGRIVAATDAGLQAGTGLEQGWRKFNTTGETSAQTLQNMALGAIQMATNIMGAVAALDAATSSSSRFMNILGGASTGASIGSAFGPIGAAVGAAVGAIVGAFRRPEHVEAMKDVGRDYGVAISEGLSREIAARSKEIGDRSTAIILSLNDIIQEAGGVTMANVDRWIRKTRDLFSFLERGQIDVAQATKVLDQVFPQLADTIVSSNRLASASFVELIQLTQRFGLESKAVSDFVERQLKTIGTGLAGMLAPVTQAVDGIAERVQAAQQKVDQLLEGGKTKSKEYLAALKELEAAHQDQAAAAEKYGAAIQRAGNLAMASFNAAIAGGMGMLDAIDALSPGLDSVLTAMEQLGIEVETSNLAWIVGFRDRVRANEALVASADSLNQVMVAMSSIGALNVDTLADLEAQGLQTYRNLIDAGFTETETLTIMRDWIQNVEDAHRRLGIPIDENTQRIIDQAREQGILADEALTTNGILMEGLTALIEAVGGKVPEAWGRARQAMIDANVESRQQTDQTSLAAVAAAKKAQGGFEQVGTAVLEIGASAEFSQRKIGEMVDYAVQRLPEVSQAATNAAWTHSVKDLGEAADWVRDRVGVMVRDALAGLGDIQEGSALAGISLAGLTTAFDTSTPESRVRSAVGSFNRFADIVRDVNEMIVLSTKVGLDKQLTELEFKQQRELEALGLTPAAYQEAYEGATKNLKDELDQQLKDLAEKRQNEIAQLGEVPKDYDRDYEMAKQKVLHKYAELEAKAKERFDQEIADLGPLPAEYEALYQKAVEAVQAKYELMKQAAKDRFEEEKRQARERLDQEKAEADESVGIDGERNRRIEDQRREHERRLADIARDGDEQRERERRDRGDVDDPDRILRDIRRDLESGLIDRAEAQRQARERFTDLGLPVPVLDNPVGTLVKGPTLAALAMNRVPEIVGTPQAIIDAMAAALQEIGVGSGMRAPLAGGPSVVIHAPVTINSRLSIFSERDAKRQLAQEISGLIADDLLTRVQPAVTPV